MDPRTRDAWAAARPGRGHAVDAACIAPWVTLELDPAGWVYACCANQMYPLGRIGEDRLTDLWGGARQGVLREALGRWDMSVGCASCRWHMDHGRFDPDAAVYDRYPLTEAVPAGPVAMTFALSNRCNLACVMCTPELSSTLRRQAGLPPIGSPYDDAFYEDLAGFLPGLQYAKFLGGEPFLIPEHFRVWDLMAEVGGPDRMQVTTNGTVWTDRVAEVLDRWSFDVTVSIDGASAQMYEAIRGGSDFEQVVRNVGRLRDVCRAKGTELRLCFCLMDRNWHELAPFLRWADELGAEVSINLVSDLGLALHDLPAADLEGVWSRWSRDAATVDGLAPRLREQWDIQMVQLERVLSERRDGVPAPPRQAQAAVDWSWHVSADAVGTLQRNAGTTDVAVQRDRLAAWSGGDVAVLTLAADGAVTDCVSPHPRLGLDGTLVGRRLDDVVPAFERADGRRTWILGDEVVDDVRVRTVVLSEQQPERGVAGSVVRLVLGTSGEGWVLLVAEDRMYDRAPGTVAVAPPSRRGSP
jgi:MoaA/NifB/PqqE/SkfB family radical SAM enzyme